MIIRGVRTTGISVSVLGGHKDFVSISVLVPISIQEVSGTGIGTDTEIGENTGNRYSGKSTGNWYFYWFWYFYQSTDFRDFHRFWYRY